MKYNVIIIGAGPGGYVAAIRARQLGLSVCLIEKEAPGGVCLNRGCIPTKSLLHQSGLYREIAASPHLGTAAERVDYRAVHARSRAAADTLSRGVAGLLRRNGVEYVEGEARLESARTVVVDGKNGIEGGAVILAAGAAPRGLPSLPFDGERIISSDDALALTALPRRAAIVGAGAIGLEFAKIWNDFGVEVALFEAADRVLPTCHGRDSRRDDTRASGQYADSRTDSGNQQRAAAGGYHRGAARAPDPLGSGGRGGSGRSRPGDTFIRRTTPRLRAPGRSAGR